MSDLDLDILWISSGCQGVCSCKFSSSWVQRFMSYIAYKEQKTLPKTVSVTAVTNAPMLRSKGLTSSLLDVAKLTKVTRVLLYYRPRGSDRPYCFRQSFLFFVRNITHEPLHSARELYQVQIPFASICRWFAAVGCCVQVYNGSSSDDCSELCRCPLVLNSSSSLSTSAVVCTSLPCNSPSPCRYRQLTHGTRQPLIHSF